jgi:predicted Ser/Thr protein kinase
MAPPKAIGRYEITAELGRGGMGTVYKGHDPLLDRTVALKVLASELLAEEGMRERFLREARSAARLQHPHVVTVYEFGEVEGVPFIAMEFLNGDDLASAVKRGRLPDLDSRLAVMEQLCEGLAYAHARGVVHRDVKPSNVYLLGDGTVKIVDFGIARLEGGTLATRTGELLGTPGYMAPEQFSGAVADHRVDQWAAGVILYELVSGRRPFDAGTVSALIYQIVHTAPPPVDVAACGASPELLDILERALAKDPDQRFADLAEFAQALREVRDPTLRTRRLERGPDARVGSSSGALPTVATPRPPSIAARAAGAAPLTGTAAGSTAARTPVHRQTTFIVDGAFGETRRVQLVLLSPDDSLLVAGGTDGSIALWDLETREKIASLRNRVHLRTGHGSLTTALAFSHDGSLLASGHLDGAIYVWEIASGLELDVRLGHEGAVGGLAFILDDTTLVSGGADATLKFWDLVAARAGDTRRELRRQPDGITCLTLAKDGRVVVSGHVNRSLRVHDTADHRLVSTLHGHKAPLSMLVTSPDGELVASGARDGAVRVHHVDSREARGGHGEHGRTVAGIAFLAGARRVASVAMDSSVVIWDADEPELTRVLESGPGESLASLAVTVDGRRLIGATADGRFHVWLSRG